MTRATLAILVLLPLVASDAEAGRRREGGDGGALGAYSYAICVPAHRGGNAADCPTAIPYVEVEPLGTVVMGHYYTESTSTYAAFNDVGWYYTEVEWGQPVEGAMNNGWMIAAVAGWYTDPVTGAPKYNSLPERCDVTVENFDTYSSILVDNCILPMISPLNAGPVEPVYLATSMVIAETAAGFVSETMYENNTSLRWSDGSFAPPHRGGLSRISVVAP